MIATDVARSPSLAQLEPRDAEPLRRFWSRLSPETRYRRFLSPLVSLDEALLKRLVDVDHSDRVAIVAVIEGEIVGVARYARRDSRPDAADLAVVVADAWQRRGVGTRLLSALAARARRAGIAYFEVMTLADNPAARGLLHRRWPAARLTLSHGVLSGTVSIAGGDDVDPRPSIPAARPGRRRLGVTAAPFIRQGPDAALDLARRAERLGYDSFWVAEVTGTEAFSVLGAASMAAPGVGLGTGVLPAQVRTPSLLAMAAASLQALAPDREVLLGIGVSSPVVAADWHGSEYPLRPVAYIREFVALLRQCLSGEAVTFAGDYFQVRKFRLGVELGECKPKIVLGALGKAMLRLAGEVADGVLLNYLPASHVPWCVEQVRQGGDATIYANVHVGVGDRVVAAPHARYDLFSYAVVDAYASSFERAGFGDAVQAIRTAHSAGDRAGALSAVTDEMVSAIDVVGDEGLVRDTVTAYRNAGVDVPVVFPLTWGGKAPDALEATLEAAV